MLKSMSSSIFLLQNELSKMPSIPSFLAISSPLKSSKPRLAYSSNSLLISSKISSLLPSFKRLKFGSINLNQNLEKWLLK